jgi:molybdenum cofactor guanylyltransferase
VPDGRLLWQRQLDVLTSLGPAEVLISGPARPGLPTDIPLLTDAVPDRGPLSGIVAALEAMRSQWLVVLAIDLPEMNAEYLRVLVDLAAATGRAGVIPQHPDTGFFEPLAAVYPHKCLPVARACLASDDRSLQSFIHSTGDLMQARPIASDERALFKNWNTPGDR